MKLESDILAQIGL